MDGSRSQTYFMEELVMSALTTRQESRARAMAAFAAALDRMLPGDESTPLKGATFADFEDQVEELIHSTIPVVLEERAALEVSAQVESPGRCPHCGSQRVYMEKRVTQAEIRSGYGPVVIREQHARCRACDRTFSPSGP
jgi:DNA-directed RNA polymerase subunit RPC12/RpoP